MAILHANPAQPASQPSKIDQAVLDYLNAAQKDYYDEEIADDPRFSVWLQLSSLRTGLFSWYPFRAHARALEIGAGFGALTGLLCERCECVVATERSPHRAAAIAKRWSGKENLEVYAGEWSGLSFGLKFDYVILTGILERAGGGSRDRKRYAEYLQKAAAFLEEDGVLLLAADNRMGLRYFCGDREPHGGRAFEGIRRYPQGIRGYSFSREELKDIVETAGFCRNRFYYPLPDYKLPQLIYSDQHLPGPNLRERLIPYHLQHASLIASEQELYQDVIENGMFPFILFGAGMMFEDYMKKYGGRYRPAFLVDNDENKWGRHRQGIEIRRPEAILEVPPAKRRLIICSFYYREIIKQLQQMGIEDYKVYVQETEWILRAEEQRK